MKRIHKRQKIKTIALLLFFGVGLWINQKQALAGGINGNESRVIGAASGTFYYENEAYRAKAEYISQLSGELAADGVDLTPQQADEAIRQMYASVAEGVSGGYLYKVGGNSSTEEMDESKQDDKTMEDSEENPSTTEEIEETEPGVSVKIEEGEAEKKEEEVQEAALEVAKEVKQESNKDTVGKLVYNTETKSFVYESENGDRQIQLPTQSKKLEMKPYTDAFRTVGGCVLGIDILVLLLLLLGKCFPWQKHRRNRETAKYYVDHKRRRSIRRLAGGVYTLNVFCMTLCLIVGLGLHITLLNRNFICDNMTASGYFRHEYNQFCVTTQIDLVEYQEDVVNSLLDEIGYDGFLSMAKKQLMADLRGQDGKYDDSGIREQLEEKISTYRKTEQEELVNVVLGNLELSTKDMVGTTIYQLRIGFYDLIEGGIALYLISFLLVVFVVITMDRYQHRGVRYIAVGITGGSVVVGIISGVMYLAQIYNRFLIEPEGLLLFFREYIKNGLIILFALSCVGILVGILSGLLAKGIRRIQIEKES